jgi:hypothetical protein
MSQNDILANLLENMEHAFACRYREQPSQADYNNYTYYIEHARTERDRLRAIQYINYAHRTGNSF